MVDKTSAQESVGGQQSLAKTRCPDSQKTTRPVDYNKAVSRIGHDPAMLSPSNIIQLQRVIGNRAVQRLLAHTERPAASFLHPIVQRQPISHNWQDEADRLSAEELAREVRAMRSAMMSQTESFAEDEQRTERLAVFERTLMQRQHNSIRFHETVNEARARQRELSQSIEDTSILTPADYLLMQGSTEALFVWGFMTGFAAEIPPGELQDFEREMQEHWPDFTAGYLLGLPVGLWHGLTGLIDGIGLLLRIGFRLSPMGMMLALGEEAIDVIRDPVAYAERRRRQYEQLRAIAQALQEFGEEFRAEPTIVMQWSSDLGLALGQELGNRTTTDFLRQSPHQKGYVIGNIAGQIVFEVLLEIILLVATEGIGNILRGFAAVGQGARTSGWVANMIRHLLESSPALRRLLRTIGGVDEGADLARMGQRGADHVPNPPPGSAGGPGRRGHRGATAEGVGESFSYEFHSEVEPPAVVRGRTRPRTEGSSGPPARSEAAPQPRERFQDLEEGVPPSEAELIQGPLDEGIRGQQLHPQQRLPESIEAARQAGVPLEVFGDGWVMTRIDFPDVVPDRPVPLGRPAPPRQSTLGRRVSSSDIQNLEVRADLLLTQRSLEGSGARIVDVRIDQTQVSTTGGRAGTNRPDLQLTILRADLNGRRIHVEYDRSPPTRAINHARRILANEPDAIVILKVIDFEP